MKKIFFLSFIIFNLYIYSDDLVVNFYHRNLYYSYKLYENKTFFLKDPFFSLYLIDEKQTHKVILNPLEKSKVLSLGFVGDKYDFNDIEINCIQYYPELPDVIPLNFFENIIIKNITDVTKRESVKKYFTKDKRGYILKNISKEEKVKLYSILDNYTTIIPFTINKYLFNNIILKELYKDDEKEFILSKYKQKDDGYYLIDDITYNDVMKIYDLLKQFDYINKKYLIKDKKLNIEITFGIGEYDSIILFSILNFNEREINLFDKIATAFTVKFLLKKLTGKIEIEDRLPRSFTKEYFIENILLYLDRTSDIEFMKNMYKPNRLDTEYILKGDISLDNEKRILYILNEIKNKKESGIEEKNRKIELNNFLTQLDNMKKEYIFEYLKKFANYNFYIDISKYNIMDNWTKPWDIYYYKKGDYKSITYFYYYIFKNLKKHNFNTKLFVVCELNKLKKEDYFNYKKLPPAEQREKDRLFRYVNPKYNREELFDYYPPHIKNSILILAIEINGKWLYTMGKEWIDADIIIAERACYDFYKKGCYYSELTDTESILLEGTIYENILDWYVYFDIK